MIPAALQERGLRPAVQLAADKPHGIRLRYMAGCRCLPCRCANSRYETERAKARKAGDWNGIVSAERSRAHILKLSRAGVGYKIVAECGGISSSIVFQIRQGKRTRIRARTERRILAVTTAQRGDKSLVSAARLWQQINTLLDEGFTKAELARRLGYKTRAIQFNRRKVTARSAHRVATLYRKVMT